MLYLLVITGCSREQKDFSVTERAILKGSEAFSFFAVEDEFPELKVCVCIESNYFETFSLRFY